MGTVACWCSMTCPDPEVLCAPFVPARGTARVLITSTRQSAANPGERPSLSTCSALPRRRRSWPGGQAWTMRQGRLRWLPRWGTCRWRWRWPRRSSGPARGVRAVSGPAAGDVGRRVPDRGRRAAVPARFARAVLLSLQAVRAADRTGVCTRVMEIMAVLSAAGVRRELLYAAGQAGVLASGRHRVAAGPVDRVLEWLERPVPADLQPGRPDRHPAPSGGAGDPQTCWPAEGS